MGNVERKLTYARASARFTLHTYKSHFNFFLIQLSKNYDFIQDDHIYSGFLYFWFHPWTVFVFPSINRKCIGYNTAIFVRMV